MKRAYIIKEEIIIENENEVQDISKELATLDDVEFAICCGFDLEFNKTYEVKEGYVYISWDEKTCDLDYILIKR